jgi:hypothetical protein
VIHAAPANKGSLAGGEAEICKKVGAGDGDGGVVCGCGGTMRQSAGDAAGVYFSGFG